VAEGKLYILGGGWSLTGPDPVPSGIAIKVDVGWTEMEDAHHWELYLVDEDGRPVSVETPNGLQPIEVRGDFQIGRPSDLPAGSSVGVPFAVNFGPLPLEPLRRYTWQLTIDGETDADWMVAFSTRAQPEAPAAEQ
jgi:hypothetical protein